MIFRSFYRTFFFKIKDKTFKRVTNVNRLIFILSICIIPNVNAQAALENIEALRSQTAQFLTDEYVKTKAIKVTIKVGNLDRRLRLAHCDQKLSFNSKDNSNSGGNINVQVVCKGTNTWTILVPAQAKVYRLVAVAGRNLHRGELINTADLSTDVKDVSNYRLGFSLIAKDIVGKQVKYDVNKGEVFRNSALDAPLLIKRGDTVSMQAGAGDISVTTHGTAISDGRMGQQIRVKNNQSSRIINAKVIGPGQVQSIM